MPVSIVTGGACCIIGLVLHRICIPTRDVATAENQLHIFPGTCVSTCLHAAPAMVSVEVMRSHGDCFLEDPSLQEAKRFARQQHAKASSQRAARDLAESAPVQARRLQSAVAVKMEDSTKEPDASTSTSPPAPSSPPTTSKNDSSENDGPISTRRAKAMSIGNAASLFGAGGDDAALLFGGGGADTPSKPASMAQSPFDAIGEESEEPAASTKQSAVPQSVVPANEVAESPSDSTAAALFGDAGQTPPVEWLGGATSSSLTASSDDEASKLFAGVPQYQQTPHDPSLYASGQFGDAQYGYDYSTSGQQGYNHQQPNQQQYAQYPAQAQQQQVYGQYDEPAVDNFNQNMYHDPVQQQQYQQSLQAQAHAQQAPMAVNGQSQVAYEQQQYMQYGADQYALPAAPGQEQYASYYGQQPYSAQQPQQQPASAYQAQGYLAAQQSYQTPYSAPAGPAQSNQFAQSQASQAGKPSYASAYSQTYDPYAPSHDPYAAQQSYQPSTSSHTKQNSLSASNTVSNLAVQSTSPQQLPGQKDPNLNRSASSFFAELPPMPVKIRPASAAGARASTSAAPPVPPMPAGHQQQAMPPPPPKSKSPSLRYGQQRPPSRVKSTQSVTDYGGWSPSMGGSSHSRPGSRTAQRQDSLVSTSSHLSQPETSISSFSQTQHSNPGPGYGQPIQNGIPATGLTSSAPVGAYGGYQPVEHSAYDQHGVSSPPMSNRQSLDSNRSCQGQQTQHQPHSTYPTSSNQSRPQSRTSHQAHPSPSGSQKAVLPPAKRGPSRNMDSGITHALSPKQQSLSLQGAEHAGTSNQLGLSEDDQMETLMDSFSKQRIGGDEQGVSLASAEASLKRAIKTPLPASEPDTEPRMFSPHQGEWSDLGTATSPSAEVKSTLSPQSVPVPLLSVSMPSPEVEKKPVSLASDDYSTSYSQRDSSETTSDVREAEDELIKAEQDIKLEEIDMDLKPAREALAYSEGWTPSREEVNPYSTALYEAEESKPSPNDLQRAWPGDTSYSQYSATAADYQGNEYDPHQQDPYQQSHTQSYAYGSDQHTQVPPGSQYNTFGSQAAYGQPMEAVGSPPNAYEPSYGQPDMHLTANGDEAYAYTANEGAYVPTGHEQASTPYEPYQPNTGAPYQNFSSNDETGQQRLQNRPAIPIASFGFNGKLVTFFPSSTSSTATASYGMYEQAGSSIPPVKIQKLSDILPKDVAGIDTFPGPLFMDTGSTSASGKAKKKKELVAWLTTRIEESQQECSYLGAGATEDAKAKAEQKTIVLQLVKILLEQDGKLTGTPQIDQLVQQTLVPHLSSSDQSAATFAVAADLGKQSSNASAAVLSQATSGDLDTLQMHLLKGEKREAVTYALNNRLYTHALVIASGTDKALMAEVVKDFLAFELSGDLATGREPLKVAYSLLAGSGPACIHQFVSPKPAAANGYASQVTSPGQASDLYAPPASRAPTPTGRPTYPSDVPAQTLSKWQETAAIIIANHSPGDHQALTSLGEVLSTNSWYKAAHACYLLSPSTSTLGGPSVPGVRWSLLGAPDPLQDPISANNLEAIIMTEIVEFAFSLVPVPKGQEVYIGLPHLQAYRVLHANHLADTGHHSKAQKYCDAIGATLKLATKRSPFYHPTLLGQVKELSDRLSMVSFQDKTGSWISRKVQRPTIDNVWSTLESRFAKFVTGDGEEDPAEEERKRKARDAAKGVVGPFAHYSSITPQGPEGLSRNGSYADLTARSTPPPQPTSVPNTVSNANTTKATHHRRSSSYAYGPYGADPYGNYVPQMPQTAEEPEQQGQEQGHEGQPQDAGHHKPQYGYVTPQNDSGWWSNSNGGQEHSPYGSSSSYGQAPTFSPVTEGFGSSDSQGLMSPMGFNQSPNMTSQNFQPQPSKLQQEVSAPAMMQGDEDDLGLGNSSARRKRDNASTSNQAEGTSAETEKKAEATKKEEAAKQAASGSGSWLGRIFRREGSASPTAGPIRAKLGEETSFIYDPVEKRWVNKKVGSDTPPPASTPPPPRAQTASPAGYNQSAAATVKSGTPPPPSARSASAAPMQFAASAAAPPARSTPPPVASSSSSMPAPPLSSSSSFSSRPPSRAASIPGGELPPPPARKPGGSAAAKKARSRYVDVFAQEQK